MGGFYITRFIDKLEVALFMAIAGIELYCCERRFSIMLKENNKIIRKEKGLSQD